MVVAVVCIATFEKSFWKVSELVCIVICVIWILLIKQQKTDSLIKKEAIKQFPVEIV